jgi:acid phosphatase
MDSRIPRSWSTCVLAVVAGLLTAAFVPAYAHAGQEPAAQPCPAPCDLGEVSNRNPLRVVVIGDFGYKGDGSGMDKVREAILARHNQKNYDIGITVGDNFYPRGVRDVADLKDRWAKFAKLGLKFYATLGNHDYAGNPGAQVDASMQIETWRMPDRYYTFAAGPVRFIALDTDEGTTGILGTLTRKSWSATQTSWLADRLAATREAPWRIVYGHHPIRSNGEHGDEKRLKRGPPDGRGLTGLLKAAGPGVIYIAGHDHDLEYHEESGQHSFVVGGGGKDVRPLQEIGAAFSCSAHGFLELEATPEVLTFRFIGEKGDVLYERVLRKPGVASQPADRSAAAPATCNVGLSDPQAVATNAGPLIPFLEGTDVFFSLKQDTVFEADIMPHLVAVQNFTDVIDLQKQQDRQDRQEKASTQDASSRKGIKQIAYSISGTPAVRIRMMQSVSNPVRTPSYMPRGNFQLLWARVPASKSVPDLLAALASNNRVALWEAHAIVGHHSNGQDGCLYTDEERSGEDCPSVRPIGDKRIINKKDGSFSTNYVRVGFNYSRNHLDSTLWANREKRVKVEVEQHFHTDKNIVDLYGRTRVKAEGAVARRGFVVCPKRAEILGRVEYIHGHPDSVWPVAVTAQASCFPTMNGGWGFFARYYGGQDYYNLGFLDNIQRFQIGATFNQSGFFRFKRSAPDAADSPDKAR